MAVRRSLLRIPRRRLDDELLPALIRARDEATLEPLRGLVADKALADERHILSGKRYLLFGPEEKKLIRAEILLSAGLGEIAEGSVDAKELDAIRDALLLAGKNATMVSALLTDGHGVPDWLAREGAPSILGAKESERLLAELTEARPLVDAARRTPTDDLIAFVRDAGDSSVLARV